MSMGETLVTVVGYAATRPELKLTAAGVPVTRFRVASTERRFDRTGQRWTDGHTSFYTVWAWRALGENVAGSVGVGEPLIVQGRLRVREREDKGQGFVSADIDAVAVGHDLNRGTSAFRRMVRTRPEAVKRRPGADPDVPSTPAPEAAEGKAEAAPAAATGPGSSEAAQLELVPF